MGLVLEKAAPEGDGAPGSIRLSFEELAEMSGYGPDFLQHFGNEVFDPESKQSMLDAYREGHVGIHLHFISGHGGVDRQEWCAVFKCFGLDETAVLRKSGHALLMPEDEGNNDLVFIHYVEIVDQPKSGRLRSIPSRIERLQPLKFCNYRGFHTPSLSVSVLPEFGGGQENGKLGHGCGLVAACQDKLMGEIVECRSDLMSKLSKQNSDSQKIGLRIKENAPIMYGAIGIFIGHDLVGLGVREGCDSGYDGCRLLFGPT